MNQTANFLSRRDWAIQRIRTASGGKGLLKASETRWNFKVDRAERLLEKEIFDEAKKIIDEEHLRLTDRPSELDKIPPRLDDQFHFDLSYFVNIGNPLAVATDVLQQDNVTSHLVIPTILEAFHSVENIDGDDLGNFRGAVIRNMESYFTSWMNDPAYIIPVILNPATKLHFFSWYHREFNYCNNPLKLPTVDEAREIILHHFKPVRVNSGNSIENAVKLTSTENLPQWLKAMKKASKNSSPVGTAAEEIITYLESPQLFCSILDFWKTSSSHYGTILPLVFMFLTLPSSTAAVERLFSFIGQQNRKDRESLDPVTLEELVLWFEQLAVPVKTQKSKTVS